MTPVSRRLRLALLTLTPVFVFLALLGWLTWRHVRQEHLDRALIAAVAMNDASASLRLLGQGADPNTHDRRNESPVGWREYLPQVFGHKLTHKALTALQLAMADQDTPYAYDRRDYAIALALLDHGADPNRWTPDGQAWPEDWTPLMQAAYASNAPPRLITSLLAHGARVNAKGSNGWTALMVAVWRPDKFVAEMLVDSGADVNARDSQGETILMNSCQGNRPDVVRFLLAHGADVNATDVDGCTALMAAARGEDPALVRLLLAAGANVNARDKSGFTALHYAQGSPVFLKQHPAALRIMQLLKQHGAKE